jgi:RimJ/RimL family protein N-acetyltransferase
MPGDTSSAQPPFPIEGKLVALGPLERDLLPLYRRWQSALETQLLAGFPEPLQPVTVEQTNGWYERATTGAHAIWFTIYARDTGRPIGHCHLRDVDYMHRTAEFGITIGERDLRGRGYGAEATSLLVDYAFTGLGLNNVMLDVFEFNTAGRRAYEKAGFREMGRRRGAHYAAGRFWDVIFMDIVAADFASPVLRRQFSRATGQD